MVRTHSLHARLVILLFSVVISHQSPLATNSKSPMSLPLARNVNATGAHNVLKLDQARAKALRARVGTLRTYTGATDVDDMRTESPNHGPTQASTFNAGATGRVVSYTVNVAVGNPPTSYDLLIDTGSSNTWVGADLMRPSPKSCQFTHEMVSVSYGSGNFEGVEQLCQVTLAKGLTIPNQSIGVAITSKGFDHVDGILGIGPVDLTKGSLLLEPGKQVPTVTDSAHSMNLLTEYEVGISFEPLSRNEQKNGELTFGGVNKSKFTGPLHYTSLTKVSPASKYVGIDQSITYGKDQMVMHSGSGILDTGTTLILLASDAFQRYRQYTGGKPDKNTGLLRITPAQYNNLKSLKFTIGGVSYELTPNAQIWPRALNAALGGSSDGIYLVVGDLGQMSGKGLDFIDGMGFLERFYMVYDVGNSRAGLATTPFTYATTN